MKKIMFMAALFCLLASANPMRVVLDGGTYISVGSSLKVVDQ